VKKSEGKKQLRRRRIRWNNNIKMNFVTNRFGGAGLD
jgi:hypothetical protein